MKLNQRLLVHIGIDPSPYGTPSEVTVMEFSPCENFVKLNPAIGPRHSTFRKEETRQSMADAVRLAGAIFQSRYTHSGFHHSTQETCTK